MSVGQSSAEREMDMKLQSLSAGKDSEEFYWWLDYIFLVKYRI